MTHKGGLERKRRLGCARCAGEHRGPSGLLRGLSQTVCTHPAPWALCAVRGASGICVVGRVCVSVTVRGVLGMGSAPPEGFLPEECVCEPRGLLTGRCTCLSVDVTELGDMLL